MLPDVLKVDHYADTVCISLASFISYDEILFACDSY